MLRTLGVAGDIEMEDKVRAEVMNLCVLMHQTVRETSAAYLAQARRPRPSATHRIPFVNRCIQHTINTRQMLQRTRATFSPKSRRLRAITTFPSSWGSPGFFF